MKLSRDLRQRLVFLAAGFAAGALALGVGGAVWSHHRPPATPPSLAVQVASTPGAGTSALMAAVHAMPPAAQTPPPISDPVAARVAARFQCTCPDHCGLSLDHCNCATAAAERSYLSSQLQLGRSEAEAIQALDQKYGGIRM